MAPSTDAPGAAERLAALEAELAELRKDVEHLAARAYIKMRDRGARQGPESRDPAEGPVWDGHPTTPVPWMKG